MHDDATHLVEGECAVDVGVILHRCHVDVYLARNNAIHYPALAVLERNDVGVVVVAEEVARAG